MESSSELAAFLGRYSRIFVLTGAGCSTASGIADYRDERGAWKRRQPITLQALIGSEHARKRYWARSLLGWQHMAAARPNAAHEALTGLERSGRTQLLVTQNVDGLHQRAGSRRVVDLHGTLDEVECLRCSVVTQRRAHQDRLIAANEQFLGLRGAVAPDGDMDLEGADYESFQVLDCAACGGVLKPRVVFFGESVPKDRVERAYAALEESEAMLVVGTSLMVFSGYRFAHRAALRKMPLAIVNRGVTRADLLATLKVEADVGAAIGAAVAALGNVTEAYSTPGQVGSAAEELAHGRAPEAE